jgi:DNA-binding transcriptional regulator YiaG
MAKKIKVNVYDDMRQSLADARAFERGETVDLRVTDIPSPPKPMKPEEIRKIRLDLDASQARFAQYLCVSTNTVQSWEQGTRRPQSTALRLLTIAKKNPPVLLWVYARTVPNSSLCQAPPIPPLVGAAARIPVPVFPKRLAAATIRHAGTPPSPAFPAPSDACPEPG